MDFDKMIDSESILIYCSNDLYEFSNEFLKMFNNNINKLKEKLGIADTKKIIIVLTDDEKQANFVYGKSDFSGYFNDTGAFAYINLYGNRSKQNLFKSLMHEIIHHLYKYYVYGKDKERIIWFDEGLAQLFSGQKEELKNDDNYIKFIDENILKTNCNINLNTLKHNDKSFGYNNGYNLSYIAVRYLYENNNSNGFINLIKDKDALLEKGESILEQIKLNYSAKYKL